MGTLGPLLHHIPQVYIHPHVHLYTPMYTPIYILMSIYTSSHLRYLMQQYGHMGLAHRSTHGRTNDRGLGHSILYAKLPCRA